MGCRITAVQVWTTSREFSLLNGTSPLTIRLFLRVHENRIFIMFDFRDFFHAPDRAPGWKWQFLISRPFGIKMRELWISKGVRGNTRFSPYSVLFSEFSREIIIVFPQKSQNLWAGGIYIFLFFLSITHRHIHFPSGGHSLYWSGQGINAAKPSLETNSKN